jgi:hypothetical protein
MIKIQNNSVKIQAGLQANMCKVKIYTLNCKIQDFNTLDLKSRCRNSKGGAKIYVTYFKQKKLVSQYKNSNNSGNQAKFCLIFCDSL